MAHLFWGCQAAAREILAPPSPPLLYHSNFYVENVIKTLYKQGMHIIIHAITFFEVGSCA